MSRWRKIQGILAFCGIFILILDSPSAVAGAADGIQMCMQQVIPAIFPMLVLSIWLTQIMGNSELTIFRPLGRLLRIPDHAISLLIPAFFGGYPVGAQCTAEQYRHGSLSKETAEKMLSFCNNAGPSFIFGFLPIVFANTYRIWQIWLTHIGSAILAGIVLCHSEEKERQRVMQRGAPIMGTAVRSMALICGWVIFFRVLTGFLERWFLWKVPSTMAVVLLSLIHI